MMNDAPNTARGREAIPEFFDDQMGIPVVLLDSVFAADSGSGAQGVIIPDLTGLEAAIAVARITDSFKLNGGDIKFLRKAIGLKAVDLAGFLEVTPETLSRWETGKELMSPNAERVLRMRVFSALHSKTLGVRAELDDILNMQFRPLRLANESVMAFKRVLAVEHGTATYIWYCEGQRQESVFDKQRA